MRIKDLFQLDPLISLSLLTVFMVSIAGFIFYQAVKLCSEALETVRRRQEAEKELQEWLGKKGSGEE